MQAGGHRFDPVYLHQIWVLPRTVVCKTIPEGTEVKARGALPSAPTRLQIIIKFVIINDGKLAQLVERRPYKANVGGSNPSLPTSVIGQ